MTVTLTSNHLLPTTGYANASTTITENAKRKDNAAQEANALSAQEHVQDKVSLSQDSGRLVSAAVNMTSNLPNPSTSYGPKGLSVSSSNHSSQSVETQLQSSKEGSASSATQGSVIDNVLTIALSQINISPSSAKLPDTLPRNQVSGTNSSESKSAKSNRSAHSEPSEKLKTSVNHAYDVYENDEEAVHVKAVDAYA